MSGHLAGGAILFGAETRDDVAQCAIVDIEDPAPGDGPGVEAEQVAVVQMVVHHGGQEVVGRRHRMQIAGEVQVQRLERDDLAVAAAGSATLDPEGRPHRRLPDGDGGLLADAGQCLSQPYGGGGLSLSERGRGHRRHHDVASPRPNGQLLNGLQAHLGHMGAVGLQQRGGNAHLCRDVGDGCQRGAPCDLDGGWHRHAEHHARAAIGVTLRSPCLRTMARTTSEVVRPRRLRRLRVQHVFLASAALQA